MPVKLLGCALITASGLAVGCMLTKKLGMRRDYMSRFCVFISLMITQIRYSGADIFTLVKTSAGGAGLQMPGHDDGSESFVCYWERYIQNIPVKTGLNNSDKELLSEFGSALGTTDIDGQLKHLELYGELFQNRLEECRGAFRDKSKIYRALGLFGGISAALLIM